MSIAPPFVIRFPLTVLTATSPGATTRLDAVSTTSRLSLTLTPVAFPGLMPVSSSGKVAGFGNPEPVLLVSKGLISKLSKLSFGVTRTKFVPGTDARVI